MWTCPAKLVAAIFQPNRGPSGFSLRIRSQTERVGQYRPECYFELKER